jgi:hypothetical protein
MKCTPACLELALAAAVIALSSATTGSADEPRDKPSAPAPANKVPDRGELEKKFSESMSGATFDGYFTETPGDEAKPRESKYVINKASKVKDDLWLFEARIKYGDHDLTVPIPLVVRWAGDTPVITLDNAGIPGFGTFSARVLIFDNSFAGTWSGGNHRGELYGRVVKPSEREKSK